MTLVIVAYVFTVYKVFLDFIYFIYMETRFLTSSPQRPLAMHAQLYADDQQSGAATTNGIADSDTCRINRLLEIKVRRFNHTTVRQQQYMHLLI